MKKTNRVSFLIIVMLSIYTIISCDSTSTNDGKSLLMLTAVSSNAAAPMQFTVEGDTMSWSDCTFDGIVVVGLGTFYTVIGKDGTETLVLGCGNGSVGNHDGSSSASNEYIKYTMDGYDYYGRSADGGTSKIYVSKVNNSVMEGTFYGRVCHATEGCLIISSGSFHATAE